MNHCKTSDSDQISKESKNMCKSCSADLKTKTIYFYKDSCYCQCCCPWKEHYRSLSFPIVSDFIQSINLQI